MSEGGDPLPAAPGLGESKGDGGLRLFGWINSFHFFERFNPGLCLRCLGCLGTKPADKILMMGYFPLLVSIGRQMLGFTLFFLNQKIFKVSGIPENLTVTDLQDVGADRIEKGPVVGNRKHGAGEFLNLSLKPSQGFQV